jgi:type I restriction enzyme R subunit
MGGDKKIRILAGYHQYFAVKKALECTKQALQRNDGKIGVFWHTQGSGKSLSMVFYAHQLLKNLLSATLLVLTDRLDLNDQLHSTFASCSDYLRQKPIKLLMQKPYECSKSARARDNSLPISKS